MIKKFKKVFLATPITPLLDKNNLIIDDAKYAIQNILKSLRDTIADEVFCAIEREKWGEELMSGAECTSLDMQGVIESELIIAFADHSYGVHLELGWASAFKKPIIVMINTNIGVKTPLVEGLGTVTSAKIIYYKSNSTLPSLEQWNSQLQLDVINAIAEIDDKVTIKNLGRVYDFQDTVTVYN
ncbi:MAG: hypothetical protein HQK52_07990 [Oligoflexia bacterium]|nr:hypothetical protein [Oligoflexia bacterium]